MHSPLRSNLSTPSRGKPDTGAFRRFLGTMRTFEVRLRLTSFLGLRNDERDENDRIRANSAAAAAEARIAAARIMRIPSRRLFLHEAF